MTVATRTIDYEIDGQTHEAILSGEGDATIIICHAWAGRSEFEVKKAQELVKLGYTAVAIDLFGKGVLGQSAEENQKLIAPYINDRPMLQEKLHRILEIIIKQPEVKNDKIAAIGFCFGGLCVLDIARSGGDVKGVVSFHGLLGAPGNTVGKIDAKVLALHGWDDPMAPPSDVEAFGAEMNNAKADWQIHGYGGVMHAFTNPAANDPDFGTVYDERADRRSWTAMKNFLDEIF